MGKIQFKGISTEPNYSTKLRKYYFCTTTNGEIMRKELIILSVLLGIFLATVCAGNKDEAPNNTVTSSNSVTPVTERTHFTVDNKTGMQYEETYYGYRVIVTTFQQSEGDWKSKVELLDSGKRVPLGKTLDERYSSEEEAKRAALSTAAGVIDRIRISKGKP